MNERIEFPRSIYSLQAVEAAVEAYSKLASFEVSVLDDDIEVKVSKPAPKVADVLVDEFCNHVLYETVVRSRG